MNKVSAVFIITIFLLAALSIAIYRTKRSTLDAAPERDFFPSQPRGLFDSTSSEKTARATSGDSNDSALELATKLRERARNGELTALSDAWASGNRSLYDEVLETLLKREANVENVRAVASSVVESNMLRSNKSLAEALLLAWTMTPDDIPLTDLVRVAALSDDADTFSRVVEEIAGGWLRGGVRDKSAEQLRLLFESEFWVLASEARRTGAGFLLKQKLAEVHRRLSAETSLRQTLSNGPGEL